MFRNPRENSDRPPSARLTPSVGRPPSPPRRRPPSTASTTAMAAKAGAKTTTPRRSSTPLKARQTTLVPQNSKKDTTPNGAINGKAKPKANGNIMAFFKKAEEQNNRLFLEERGFQINVREDNAVDGIGWEDTPDVLLDENGEADRYNEVGGSVKRRKMSEGEPMSACTPPPPDVKEDDATKVNSTGHGAVENPQKIVKRTGPFLEDSDSEAEDFVDPPPKRLRSIAERRDLPIAIKIGEISDPEGQIPDIEGDALRNGPPSFLKSESTSYSGVEDFDGFQDLEDEEALEGEEYDERRYMAEQKRLEMAEAGFQGELDDFDARPMFEELEEVNVTDQSMDDATVSSCPICSVSLSGLCDQEASVHVNGCLDGKPVPLPEVTPPGKGTHMQPVVNSKIFKRPPRPAKAGQENPFTFGSTATESKSAFSKIMASHVEDAAWATAAASESAARGKPAYQRTCPFYKILPGFYICVDAFRYGAVKGQQAYFLSHFHSDHYIGLTSSWAHGPIYCSHVTANLVRQQLRVDPKWVVDLDFEKKTEVPGTEGVHVTMIPANHCPGSSLFLFEKEIVKGKNPKLQRVLHCGDFRACRAHVEHPLLRPEVLDVAGGKSRQQKLDVCYLDTTYLNPKYAFPPQEQVIKACADMCVSLNKVRADESDGWEKMKRERAGEGMVKFVQKGSDVKQEEHEDDHDDPLKVNDSDTSKDRGRLLVVVGTYSIGKERICLGIARALKSKIYAPPSKQRICNALEDPELNALLTNDPREAQVHMTPLFEIRAETLEDYLKDYRDQFSRAVGFRPSGWNYRPPNSRFVESPSVQTVLHSQNWKSSYSMRELFPQRGSTSKASCFGVPYSEHSSFRELTMFCCALRIDKIIPTVNIGNAKTREKMKAWCEKWATEKKKNGLFRLEEGGAGW